MASLKADASSGNLPYVYALVKYGSIMKTVDVFAPIYRNDYFKIFIVVCIAMLPMAVNRSGILESDWIPRVSTHTNPMPECYFFHVRSTYTN